MHWFSVCLKERLNKISFVLCLSTETNKMPRLFPFSPSFAELCIHSHRDFMSTFGDIGIVLWIVSVLYCVLLSTHVETGLQISNIMTILFWIQRTDNWTIHKWTQSSTDTYVHYLYSAYQITERVCGWINVSQWWINVCLKLLLPSDTHHFTYCYLYCYT